MVLVLAIFPAAVFATDTAAATPVGEVQRIVLDDGSYFEITTIEFGTRATNAKTGTRTFTYKDPSGTVHWTATLTARFTYNGTTATCINAVIQASVINTAWYLQSKSANPNGNTATGTVYMGYMLSGATTKVINRTITLTCDKNGNLS